MAAPARALAGLLVMVSACVSSPVVDTTAVSSPVTTAGAVGITTSSTTPTTASTTWPTTTTTSTPALASLDMSDAVAAKRMQIDLAVLLAEGPRVSGTAAEREAIRYFAFEAAAITGAPSRIQPVPLPNGTESANVWAATVGSGGPVLLLGAHLDSIAGSPGADDNASGAVVLLELLRRLVDDPPVGLEVVMVGFGAEEFVPGFDHHYGSKSAAGEMAAAGALPDLMLSVDMIGVGSELYAVDYRGVDVTMADEVVAAAAADGIDVGRLSRGDISDHVPFAIVGVPTAFLWRGDNPAYHTPGDGTVQDAALLETLHVLEALVAHVAETEQRSSSLATRHRPWSRASCETRAGCYFHRA